ncbi:MULTISPECIES: carbohydrate ABC transporter permease [unclassified Paenibacillus]|uniref:carbohydrate ABC transporter permease n=1 Tax=unclassified Paenibacillus TaxID=185978 RepID=UPI002404CA7C|nr:MULTISPECIES: carbohydrate ABC transporter permease [unclassified Paenibacillus]MDF9841456.1 ABC-type glycerol-3-phosphate transport system permease component [Paenibacillus sp. PastF-2]MDF9848046.1 ABC-type glycerol-3-phosphate transport system permease component [Paenibacillus sp. PastM-2]MDF9854615.1 ABC-type glycerol-3-phosphate transport system permease component [Paenibacillus sp. PastF-1]MDH6479777.1 ABC-type glycerol-3-phosphate transport system permease component [Paenibacillus sp. 
MKTLIRAPGLVLRTLISVLLIVIFLTPFYWMILTAFKTLGEVLAMPPKFWVQSLQWQNFKDAFTRIDFLHYTRNSLIITLGTLIGQVLVVVPAAYAFARYDFKGKNGLFGTVLATMMIPGQLIFLPIFVMFAKSGLLNTYVSLIVPFIASGTAIFMLRQTFMQVPDSQLEAARLDNAGEFKIIYTIMMPAAIPTLSTLALLTFIGTWNSYFFPLVWTTTDAVRTLPLGIQRLQDIEGLSPQIVMAGNMMLIVPILLVFVVARKQIIKAFTYMGVK